MDEFDNHQNIHSSCWYMFIATSSAFGMILDVLCLLFVVFVIFSFLLLDTGNEMCDTVSWVQLGKFFSFLGICQGCPVIKWVWPLHRL